MENDCNSLDKGGIMHDFSKFPRNAHWSECSVQEIDDYLGNENFALCLRNVNNNKTLGITIPKRDLTKTCKSISSKYRYDSERSNCTSIRCTKPGQSYNYPIYLDFENCNKSTNRLSTSHTGSLCYRGECVSKANLTKDGSWSEWYELGCQGKSLIGYKKITRRCDNPK
ncbi:unnamed protein product [Gordionus sp. m RMFG-2023]